MIPAGSSLQIQSSSSARNDGYYGGSSFSTGAWNVPPAPAANRSAIDYKTLFMGLAGLAILGLVLVVAKPKKRGKR